MRVMVGCPVSSREWIIGDYMDFATYAVAKVTDDFSFVFLASVGDPTRDAIAEAAERLGVEVVIIDADEDVRVDRRSWNYDRYEHMADLRNQLLGYVREQEPDLFLSLDSDMLMHPSQFESMVDNLGDFDAIGGKAYLSHRDTNVPNYGIWKQPRHGSFMRQNVDRVMKVDVLMAIKLMTPTAYNVDYDVAVQGEDIGWSMNARDAGLSFVWDGLFASKHVMHPDMLSMKDDRCGY